jgi:hypothetical protein
VAANAISSRANARSDSRLECPLIEQCFYPTRSEAGSLVRACISPQRNFRCNTRRLSNTHRRHARTVLASNNSLRTLRRSSSLDRWRIFDAFRTHRPRVSHKCQRHSCRCSSPRDSNRRRSAAHIAATHPPAVARPRQSRQTERPRCQAESDRRTRRLTPVTPSAHRPKRNSAHSHVP